MSRSSRSQRPAGSSIESDINDLLAALAGTEEFSRIANVASGIRARVQELVDRQLTQQLARLQMPSREDVTALGEQLRSIDQRLLKIENKLSRLVPPDPTRRAKRPPRTKKPAGKSGKSVDGKSA